MTTTTMEIETRSEQTAGTDWVSAGTRYYAEPTMGAMSALNLRGCPMGRSNASEADAVADLVARVNAENGLALTVADCRRAGAAEVAPAACCTFHAAGGTLELSCGGDLPVESGRHSRSCAYLAGGDCTCGVTPMEDHEDLDWTPAA